MELFSLLGSVELPHWSVAWLWLEAVPTVQDQSCSEEQIGDCYCNFRTHRRSHQAENDPCYFDFHSNCRDRRSKYCAIERIDCLGYG